VNFAVADMADEHALVLEGFAFALAAGDVHGDSVLIVGEGSWNSTRKVPAVGSIVWAK
jgi:hypothetical protein